MYYYVESECQMMDRTHHGITASCPQFFFFCSFSLSLSLSSSTHLSLLSHTFGAAKACSIFFLTCKYGEKCF